MVVLCKQFWFSVNTDTDLVTGLRVVGRKLYVRSHSKCSVPVDVYTERETDTLPLDYYPLAPTVSQCLAV